MTNDSSDPDGDTISVSAVSSGHKRFGQLPTANDDVTYTPNADFNGSDSFTYTDYRRRPDGDTANVDISVNVTVNAMHTLAVDDHGSARTKTRPVTVSVLMNDSFGRGWRYHHG